MQSCLMSNIIIILQTMYRRFLHRQLSCFATDYSRPGQALLQMPDFQEAQQQMKAGRFTQSGQYLQRVKDILALYAADDKHNYVHVLQQMAQLHIHLRQNKEAEGLLREAAQKREDQQGMLNLMGHLVRTDAKQVLEQGEQWAEEDSSQSLLFGSALLLQGHFQQAEQFLGKEGCSMSLNNGGVAKWQVGQHIEASLLFRQSIGEVEGRPIGEKEEKPLERLGSNRQLENLGQVWLEHYLASQQDEAETGHWLKQGLNYFQLLAPQEIGYTLVSLARLHVGQKQSIKAEGLLRHALTMLSSQKETPLQHSHLRYAQHHYAFLLDLLHRHQEAEDQRKQIQAQGNLLVERLLLPELVL